MPSETLFRPYHSPFLQPFLHLAALLFATTVWAGTPNNPLNTVAADSCSAKSPGIQVEPCAEGGKNLASIHDGDFAEYPGFDFDSGVAAIKIRVAARQKGSIEVRLDSLTGPVMAICAFQPTAGWQAWEDTVANVDNSQAGVRDVYLIFHGPPGSALVNISRFVFLKSTVVAKQGVDLSSRLDVADDEPQATHAWGMPENGFTDDFEDGAMNHWTGSGFTVTDKAVDGQHSLDFSGGDPARVYTPNVYINKTDTGGEWRTLAEASLAADIVMDSTAARPGIGFSSKDGQQWIDVVLNPANNTMEAHRKLLDGTNVVICQYPQALHDPTQKWTLQEGVKYRLQIDWSPYSDGLIAFLKDDKGAVLTSFRTVIDLPAARRPLLLCSGGAARFDDVKFDPTLDGWNYKWQWKKEPVLEPDVCNPAIWKGKDGKMYMMWRKFGQDTFHGIASSDDGLHWTRINDAVLKCTGDMNVVVDPFGDGLLYVTPGNAGTPWSTSDGSQNYTAWTTTQMNLGTIFGNNRIQEIIDTKRYPAMSPVSLNGVDYRFIAYCEDWTRMPKPHSVVLLSNTLTDWVLGNPDPVIPPGDQFWGEKGTAIGSAYPLPDGNILIAACACTNAGYTGAPEPSNVTAIADGRQPWKILKLGTLPDAPVSRENVWYQGPNFGTALFYDAATDTLLYYGGFHDYRIGLMRIQHFLHPEAK
jgi:hypothetical protein